MRRRFTRIFSFAVMLVMLLMCFQVNAFAASSNSFRLLNMTGCSISEVYFYPTYNSNFGQPRNRGWIYNGNEITVSFTNAEMRLNTDWSMRLCYIKNGYHYYSVWDNISPSDFTGAGSVVITSNEYGGMTIDFGGNNPTSSGSFTLLNMTGSSITEVYFYPMNNSNFGQLRNANWVLNGNELNVRFTANELALDVDWCMRLGFASGKYSFVYWENVPIDAFVNSGYVTIYIDNGTYMYEIY